MVGHGVRASASGRRPARRTTRGTTSGLSRKTRWGLWEYQLHPLAVQWLRQSLSNLADGLPVQVEFYDGSEVRTLRPIRSRGVWKHPFAMLSGSRRAGTSSVVGDTVDTSVRLRPSPLPRHARRCPRPSPADGRASDPRRPGRDRGGRWPGLGQRAPVPTPTR